MKFIGMMSILGLFLVLEVQAQDKIAIQAQGAIIFKALDEIDKTSFTADSVVFNLVGGTRFAFLLDQQKWTFSQYLSASGKDRENKFLNQVTYFLNDRQLFVKSDGLSDFSLMDLSGNTLEQTQVPQKEWNVNLKNQNVLILNVKNSDQQKSYLIQPANLK